MKDLYQYCSYGVDQPDLSAAAFLVVSSFQFMTTKDYSRTFIRKIYKPGILPIVDAVELEYYIFYQINRIQFLYKTHPLGFKLQAEETPELEAERKACELIKDTDLRDITERLLEFPKTTMMLGCLYEKFNGGEQ